MTAKMTGKMTRSSRARAVLDRGATAAIGAALLFGLGTPLAKLLLAGAGPWVLAGLLYLGAGVGLLLWRVVRRAVAVRPSIAELRWVLGSVVCGGLVAPVLLMIGLSTMPATGASLLLNTEGPLTAVLAWVAFREHIGRRVALGMIAIAIGTVVLSWSGSAEFAGTGPILAVLGACLLWALDNNLTRQVSHLDAIWLAMVKGLTAGSANLILGLALGRSVTTLVPVAVAGALLVGFASYGASLALFVVGLRRLGAARAGAYFSIAPFFGAALAATLLREPVTTQLAVAAGLMGIGVWLQLTERHDHMHRHGDVVHAHPHYPDVDHRHPHTSVS